MKTIHEFGKENPGMHGNGFFVKKESDKAILVEGRTSLVWLPKSQIKIEWADDKLAYIAMPKWLAHKNDDLNTFLF